MTPDPVCPHPERLQAYKNGSLEESQATLLVVHLGRCSACRARLDSLPELPLFGKLRKALVRQAKEALPPVSPPEDRRSSTPVPSSDPRAAFADLERYRLLEEAGRGGFGIVYKAVELRTSRTVAVKILSGYVLASPEAVVRFREGVRHALSHPQIVPVYEASTHRGIPYLVMSWIDGGTLAQRLDQHWHRDASGSPTLEGPLAAAPLRELIRLVTDVARTLHFLHQHGVLHRDVKPSNVLLDTEGRPYITDFDLAKSLADPGQLTRADALLGTPHYMAPEMARDGARAATFLAEVYSLGVMLYETLTGRTPFASDDRESLLNRVRDEKPPEPRQVTPGADSDLEKICLKCLDKEPNARYRTTADLADDLDRWQRGEPVRARPVGRLSRLGYWARRNRVTAALAAAILVLALAALGATGFGLVQRARAAEQFERAAWDSQLNTARGLASRGDWAAAEGVYAELIASAPSEAERVALRVERVRGWFALNRHELLAAELAALLAHPGLGGHAPTIRLLQGDFLLCQRADPDQARALLGEAAAAPEGQLAPADRAYARGLLARRTDEAMRAFDEALLLDSFHHRAHVNKMMGLIYLGMFAEAREQQRFMARVFTHDPLPAVAAVALSVLELRDWKAVEEEARALEQRLGKEHATRLLAFFKLMYTALQTLHRGDSGTVDYLIVALQTQQMRLFFKDEAGPMNQFGLLVAVFPWILEAFQETLAAMLDAYGKKWDTALERLDRAIERHPEGLFYWAAGSIHIDLAAKASKAAGGTEAMYRHAEKAIALYARAATAPTIALRIRDRARVGHVWIDAMQLWEIKPRDLLREARVRENLAEVIGRNLMTARDRTMIIPTFYDAADPEFCRALVQHWRSREPNNLAPVRLSARFELREGEFLTALRTARAVLAREPEDKEMREIERQALEALRKLPELRIDTGP